MRDSGVMEGRVGPQCDVPSGSWSEQHWVDGPGVSVDDGFEHSFPRLGNKSDY